MGACYGKGSGPNDPDKAPYGRDEKRRRRGKDAKNVGGRQSEEPGVDVVSRGERSPADNEYGGNDESDPEKRRTTTLGQRHGDKADDRHQIESATVQMPTNKVVLQPATDDIFKQSPPKRDTRLSTGRPEDNAASLLDAKEERASRPRQPSVTRERVPPKADIPSSARVGDGPAIGRRSETTSTTSTTTKAATRRGRSEDSEIVTDEDVSIRILHQPKLKAESPWTVGSKSQTYSNAEDDDDKGQRSTVSSPPRVAGIGENEKKVVNGRREDVRPADVSGVIGGGRKTTFGEVPRAEVLKTEVEKAENATKQPKDFGFSERSRAAGTNVENGVLDSNQTKPVSKRTTSSKSDERGASPVQYRNGTASVTADVNSFIKPEKSEREASAEQHEVNTVSGRHDDDDDDGCDENRQRVAETRWYREWHSVVGRQT
ncbi:hypothetical protein LSH36_378g02052 [Paralvinella palmiformis]|uniref:Uncharacterized protein n=1 Tax=Paralvinella palmiformis TaxID=53620 RepID=A0AAD9JDX7_9ANNE|nr:hypothetical protein LSH36_378g02052 [Paralvinella palmiformis]